MRFTFTTYDEEYEYASRIGERIEEKLEELGLDTVNKQFIITVEVEESNT